MDYSSNSSRETNNYANNSSISYEALCIIDSKYYIVHNLIKIDFIFLLQNYKIKTTSKMSVPIQRQMTPEFGSIQKQNMSKVSNESLEKIDEFVEQDENYCDECMGPCDECHARNPPSPAIIREKEIQMCVMATTSCRDIEFVKEVVKRLEDHVRALESKKHD
jgi:hypothetical protein